MVRTMVLEIPELTQILKELREIKERITRLESVRELPEWVDFRTAAKLKGIPYDTVKGRRELGRPNPRNGPSRALAKFWAQLGGIGLEPQTFFVVKTPRSTITISRGQRGDCRTLTALDCGSMGGEKTAEVPLAKDEGVDETWNRTESDQRRPSRRSW